ncbi:hypothetical protein HDV05_004542 [Chytridiales sp. JEL 0842]|nr:hypothetical protein HDV05_004542 [Chytridiales sp. JEL 0842]
MGDKWYTDAADYWHEIEPTVNGMLGGFAHISDTDTTSSLKFIEEFINRTHCGAGIGRVSKHFLLRVFKNVDLVEQNPKFLEEAEKSYLAGAEYEGRLRFFPKGLQDFEPEGRHIKVAIVTLHLISDDFCLFFQRCKKALKPGSLIGIKENITQRDIEIDEQDSSMTRSDDILKALFRRAGLKLIKEELQKGFPKKLYGVKMYMLEV